MWLLSLVLSLASALSATLTQQWARRYIQLPEMPSLHKDQARVRSYLFLGMQKYKMYHAVETTPTLLHLSVFLFFVGLVIFFFPINKTVAVVLSISIGLFGLVYFALTILPCIAHDCPYRTPMSNIWWYLWHASLSSTASCLLWLLIQVHGCLVPPGLGEITSRRQRILVEWIESFEKVVKKHTRRLKDGFRASIIQGALKAPVDVDLRALGWLFKLPALADRGKVQEFVASIPGETVVRLMDASIRSGGVLFREHLYTLLRSCAPGAVGLDEGVRRRRLLVCLEAIRHIAKASVVPNGVSLSGDVLRDARIDFANIGLMRALWADSDPATRVTARSICALFAKHLLRKDLPEEQELAWLHEVIGSPSHRILASLRHPVTADRMNIDSFVYGVLSNQSDNLPNERVFVETLVILMNAGSQAALRRNIFMTGLSALVQRAEHDDDPLHVLLDKLYGISEHFHSGGEREVTNAGRSNETVGFFSHLVLSYHGAAH
jgi:Family of unknown function (DUF6535)